jgi:oligoribonuclease NrnB/cAMP/cGMP phosphodiesterase (DHH superfamily)
VLNPNFLLSLGISQWGYTEDDLPKTFDHFSNWLKLGYDEPLAYLKNEKAELRASLKNYFPEFQSAVVFIFDYSQTKKDLMELDNPVKIASYALGFEGEDYHFVLRDRLGAIANELLKSYKLEIINVLGWFNKNKDKFIKGDKFIIINAQDNIKDSMIGTLCGILCSSNVYSRNYVILGMVYTFEGDIKISMRTNNPNIDLREIIKKVANGGGHSNACGAFIKREDEQEFINRINSRSESRKVSKDI